MAQYCNITDHIGIQRRSTRTICRFDKLCPGRIMLCNKKYKGFLTLQTRRT